MTAIKYETASEIVELTEEEQAEINEVELTKRQRRFNKNIEVSKNVRVTEDDLTMLLASGSDSLTQRYTNKRGDEFEFDVLESDAMYYLMYDQPDEPQITAAARDSKSGRPRVSDEA